MSKTIALLHASDADDEKLIQVTDRFRSVLKALGADPSEIVGCPDLKAIPMTLAVGSYETLVVGWGMDEKPNWGAWFQRFVKTLNVRHVLVLDLTDDDWTTIFPMKHTRRRQRGQINSPRREELLSCFHAGQFTGVHVPYGYKRKAASHLLKAGESNIAPRDDDASEEVSIVRLIFDLYVNGGQSRSAIALLLNAKGVKPPHNNARWALFKVDHILCDPVYIGALRYKDLIRFNSCEPIIIPDIFYAAQARMYGDLQKSCRQVASLRRQAETGSSRNTPGEETHEE